MSDRSPSLLSQEVTPIFLVISNCPEQSAADIARALIERRCAACVTLTPVQSVYRWEGEICVDREVTLTAKVSEPVVDRCMQALRDLHPYELPELLVLPVDLTRSLPDYLRWVSEECQEPRSPQEILK